MLLAIGFLSFVVGSFLTFTDSFPANHLTDAFRGGQALLAQQTQYDDAVPERLLAAGAQPGARGHGLRPGARRPTASPSTPPATRRGRI